MSEYGRQWESGRRDIEAIRVEINRRPLQPITSLGQLDAEIVRLTALRKRLAAADAHMHNIPE